jgi:protein regulator of cytokinesis 1
MKELVFKKQNEPEEVYRGAHMDVDSDAARQILISLIESGFNQKFSCFHLTKMHDG